MILLAKPKWHDNKDYDIEPIISFKTESTHYITFLDEGEPSKSTIKYTENGIDKEKEVPSVKFSVKENDEIKTYTPISKALIKDIEKLFPIENRTFRIELIKGRTSVENIYKINEVD